MLSHTKLLQEFPSESLQYLGCGSTTRLHSWSESSICARDSRARTAHDKPKVFPGQPFGPLARCAHGVLPSTYHLPKESYNSWRFHERPGAVASLGRMRHRGDLGLRNCQKGTLGKYL